MMSDNIKELHAMAKKIGVSKLYFHNKPGKPHYDITQEKKSLAIEKGAILVSDREMIVLWRSL